MEELESDRIRLRQIRPDEAEAFLAAEPSERKPPQGVSFAEGYPSEFSLEVMDLLAGDRSSETNGFTPWFIIRKSDDALIGEAGYSLGKEASKATIGYSLVESLWGQGYTTEAVHRLIEHLFSLPQVEAVEADTFPDHIASRRVMEKAGMMQIAERRQEMDGEEVDLVVYELRRADYESPA